MRTLLTSIVDGGTEIGLSGLTHLGEDHGADFFGSELLGLALELDLHDGLGGLVDDLEGEVLHIRLNLGVAELAADETLGVKDGIVGIHGDLVLRSIANETLRVGEGDEAGGGAVTLVIGNDVDPVMREGSDAGVRGLRYNAMLVSDSVGIDTGDETPNRMMAAWKGRIRKYLHPGRYRRRDQTLWRYWCYRRCDGLCTFGV